MNGCVLIIAASDSGGGAGIQADIKTVTALNGYASTAITALTAQNTINVYGVFPVSRAFIQQQINVILEDIGTDAIKTGMLVNAEVTKTVADTLQEKTSREDVSLVVDPVMFSKGNTSLLERDAIQIMVHQLFPLATLVTPNIPEAEILAKMSIETLDDMRKAAYKILRSGPEGVLVKGGHLSQKYQTEVVDILITKEEEKIFEAERFITRHTHGTGCTFASAIATGLAQNMTLIDAVMRAHDYVHQAIEHAPGYGMGYGPINHAHTFETKDANHA